jgi:hypothetical protein
MYESAADWLYRARNQAIEELPRHGLSQLGCLTFELDHQFETWKKKQELNLSARHNTTMILYESASDWLPRLLAKQAMCESYEQRKSIEISNTAKQVKYPPQTMNYIHEEGDTLLQRHSGSSRVVENSAEEEALVGDWQKVTMFLAARLKEQIAIGKKRDAEVLAEKAAHVSTHSYAHQSTFLHRIISLLRGTFVIYSATYFSHAFHFGLYVGVVCACVHLHDFRLKRPTKARLHEVRPIFLQRMD